MPRTATSSVASIVIGRAVREARQRVGITQAELARRLGSSAPHVCALENGKANPTIGHLSDIATALGLELHVEFRALPLLLEPIDSPSSHLDALKRGPALAS
jgi:transcriptional regulator with XRE-family HTH domain